MLSKLCVQAELFEMLVVRLLTKLELLCVSNRPGTDEATDDTEPVMAYIHSILSALADTLQSKVDSGHADVSKYISRLVPRLFNLFIYSAVTGNNTITIAENHRAVKAAGRIVTSIVKVSPLA